MAIFCVIIILLILVLDCYIAQQFESVAKDKGYTGRKYYYLCFFLGIIGYLLVIALPDRANQKTIVNKSVANTTNFSTKS